MAKALLVTGGTGLLGKELARVRPANDLFVPLGSADLDITHPTMVSTEVGRFAAAAREHGLPAVLVNAAAYTNADAAESALAPAYAVNALGPAHLAAACWQHGVSLVHISSDYVFDGRAQVPYEPSDLPNPGNIYGRTKLAGEWAVLSSGAPTWVVRTAWLYATHSANFLTTMARLERERPEVSVVDDQVGSPTWAGDLASGLLALADRIVEGTGPAERLLHYVNTGRTSWHGFAREVFERLGADADRVRPCTTAEFGRPAPRPAYSVLGVRAWCDAGLPRPRHWTTALAAALSSTRFTGNVPRGRHTTAQTSSPGAR